MNAFNSRCKAVIGVAFVTLCLLATDLALGQNESATPFRGFQWQSEASMYEVNKTEFARVKLSASIQLGTDSNGILPISEPVTVDFEPYDTSGDPVQYPRNPCVIVGFPAGVFQQINNNVYVARNFKERGGTVLLVVTEPGGQTVDITQTLVSMDARIQVNPQTREATLVMEAVFGPSAIVSPCLIVSLIGGANDVEVAIGNDTGTAERKKVEASGSF